VIFFRFFAGAVAYYDSGPPHPLHLNESAAVGEAVMSQEAEGPITLAFDDAVRGDVVAVGGAMETVDIDLYVDGPVPTNASVIGDFTVATYPGYAQAAAVAGANGISDEGDVMRVYAFAFTATIPVAPFETVKGLMLTGNGGGFLGAVELPTPIIVDFAGEMIAGQVMVNFTKHLITLVQAIP